MNRVGLASLIELQGYENGLWPLHQPSESILFLSSRDYSSVMFAFRPTSLAMFRNQPAAVI